MSNQLYNEISDRIEQRILNNDFNKGDKLPSERWLAQEYGVSRNVIREATRQLCEKGLIEIKPGKGSYIITPSEEKLIEALRRMFNDNKSTLYEILEVREELELSVIKKAVANLTDENIKSLKSIYEDMENQKSNISKYVNLDFLFHIELAKCTNNNMFIVLVNTFYKLADKMLFSTTKLMPNDIKMAQQHHQEIITALENKDVEQAKTVIQSHMNFIREELADLVK